MDEYSQSNAEDMEVATDLAKSQIIQFASTVGMLGGTALLSLKPITKMIDKIAKGNSTTKLFLGLAPTAIGMITGLAASFPAITLATKAKVSASRKGRFEAMSKDLKNPATFAVLTMEQQKKAEELSKNITLEPREKKRTNRYYVINLNPLEPIQTLKEYYKGNEEYKKQKNEFNKKLKI